MIDPHTGAIEIATERLLLSASLSRAEFLAAPLGAHAKVSVRNEPYCSFVLGPHELAGQLFSVVLYFHGAQLWQVELSAHDGGLRASWDDWSEAQELARKRLHEAWLKRTLGRAGGTYSWGMVESVYDPKGGASSIIVRYANPVG